MKPIDALMDEHRLIERVLDALEEFLRRAERGEADREDLRRFTDFIRGFADAIHHGKEEEVLFRAMADQGMHLDEGPLAVMLHEHETGRQLVRLLAEVGAGDGAFAVVETRQLKKAARDYVELLRAHIAKEDQVLYPMAQRLLPPEAWIRIAVRFEEKDGKAALELVRLRELAEDLAARYAG